MSPEQARGLLVGQASDVFSLGAVLTFAATGQGPFGAGPTLGLMFRVVHEPPDLTRSPMSFGRSLRRAWRRRPPTGLLLASCLSPSARESACLRRTGCPRR